MGKKNRPRTVAQYVLESRTALGLSQEEFAKALGYTQGTIAHLETGRTQTLHPLVRREIDRMVKEHAAQAAQ
jgi:transcriptional regulator with XRE-family HTH domain